MRPVGGTQWAFESVLKSKMLLINRSRILGGVEIKREQEALTGQQRVGIDFKSLAVGSDRLLNSAESLENISKVQMRVAIQRTDGDGSLKTFDRVVVLMKPRQCDAELV